MHQSCVVVCSIELKVMLITPSNGLFYTRMQGLAANDTLKIPLCRNKNDKCCTFMMVALFLLGIVHLIALGTAQDREGKDKMLELDRLLSSIKDAYETSRRREDSEEYSADIPYTLDLSTSVNPEIITCYESWDCGTLHKAMFPKNPFLINKVVHKEQVVWEAPGNDKCFVTTIEPFSTSKFLSLQVDNGTGHCMRMLFEKHRHKKYSQITRDVYEKKMDKIMSQYTRDSDRSPQGHRRCQSEEEMPKNQAPRRSSLRTFFTRK